MTARRSSSRYIILDSCIIQHFSHVDLAEKIVLSLREAVQEGWEIAFSEYSFFELLDGASLENEQERLRELGGFKAFYARKKVLTAAGRLGSLYLADGINPKQIEIGDKIIGATAVLTGSLIYTTNGRDFPAPFYRQLLMRPIIYQKENGQTVCIMEYYIQPEYTYIGAKYKERVSK